MVFEEMNEVVPTFRSQGMKFHKSRFRLNEDTSLELSLETILPIVYRN